MAIEDAGALGLALKDVLDDQQVPARLQLWDSMRRPRSSAIQLLSRILDVKYEPSSEMRAQVRKFLSDEELPDFSRATVNKMIWSHNCLQAADNSMLDRRDPLRT